MTSWNDAQIQAEFALHELNGTHDHARDALLRTRTAEEALGVWTNQYEVAGTPHMNGRLRVLQDV